MYDFVTIAVVSVFSWFAISRRSYIGAALCIALAYFLGADHV